MNALQQEVKQADKSAGCLSLYPILKIDEMFSKLGGATVFPTIDLRSGYYHNGLTRESRAKSAFVVPMGKMYTIWTQPSPYILPVTDKKGLDGM